VVNAQDKTLEALQIAIKMEIDGKEFYLKSSQASNNEMGNKLLASLAKAEDAHRLKFIEIYEAVRSQKGWPSVELDPEKGKDLGTVFSVATEEMAANTKPLDEELEAVQSAMDMEKKTLDFYKDQGAKANSDTERSYYEALAAEEREHSLVLTDYYEFLKDPAGWLTRREHSSLDGG